MDENANEEVEPLTEEGAEVTEDRLAEGAKQFELFFLRPEKNKDKHVYLRMEINEKLSGWRLKDELVESLGLKVGDTVATEVTVLLGPNIIDDDGTMDLFADGEAADWLIGKMLENGATGGCVVDGKVKFVYSNAPVGGLREKVIRKASLILEEGLRFDASEAFPF